MRPLDYSRKALPSLTENALFEPLGIAGPAGYRVLWYVPMGQATLIRSLARLTNRSTGTTMVKLPPFRWASFMV